MKPLKVLKLAHYLARLAFSCGDPSGRALQVKIPRVPTAVGGAGSRPFGYSFASVKFGKRLSWKSFGDSRRKRLIAIAILTNLVIFLTQKQFLASTIPWPSDQPSLNSSVLSNRIDNSDNLDDSILLPEAPSVADESDEDLAPTGFKRLIYLGVFLLMTTIILVIGMLSKQIARALIGASLLTIIFFVLFFVII